MLYEFQDVMKVLRESFGISRVFQAVFPKNSRRTSKESPKNPIRNMECIQNTYRMNPDQAQGQQRSDRGIGNSAFLDTLANLNQRALKAAFKTKTL
jgi:hypothetical protein